MSFSIGVCITQKLSERLNNIWIYRVLTTHFQSHPKSHLLLGALSYVFLFSRKSVDRRTLEDGLQWVPSLKLWSAVQCGLSPAVAIGWPGLQCPTAQRCPGLAPPRPAVHHHCGLAHHSPAASVSRPGASGEVIHRRKHQVSIYSTHK